MVYDLHRMQEKTVTHLLGAQNLRAYVRTVRISTNYSLIADLSAGFGIKGRLIHDHNAAFTNVQPINFVMTVEQPDNFCLSGLSFVPEKFCRPESFSHAEPKT